MIFSDNAETAHAWASESWSNGRNKGNTLSFVGPVLYSYRTVIATLHGDVALFTTEGHTITTTMHTNKALNAAGHKSIFFVRHPDEPNRPANINGLVSRVLALEKTHMRARKYKANVEGGYQELLDYLTFFHIDLTEKQQAEIDSLDWNAIEEKNEELGEVLRNRTEKQKETYDVLIKKWMSGEKVRLPTMPLDEPIRLRIVGDEFQTSWGARVPLDVAPKVWRLVNDPAVRGTTWRSSDLPRLGAFRIKKVEKDGSIVVGCHTIPFSEIARMALELGLDAEGSTLYRYEENGSVTLS